jgi:hypothetical protein
LPLRGEPRTRAWPGGRSMISEEERGAVMVAAF